MSQKEAVTSADVPQPVGPYSQAVLSGDFVFVSGYVGIDAATGALSDGIEGQTRQMLKNIGVLLAEAGCDFGDVVKSTCFLTDAANFSAFNDVYREFFPLPFPARSTIVCDLVLDGLLVEMEVIARRRAAGG